MAPPPPRPPGVSRGASGLAGAQPRLSVERAVGAMAGVALRVAGRQLSQGCGSGAPILLRQVLLAGREAGLLGPRGRNSFVLLEGKMWASHA